MKDLDLELYNKYMNERRKRRLRNIVQQIQKQNTILYFQHSKKL